MKNIVEIYSIILKFLQIEITKEDVDECSCDTTVESNVAVAFGEICYLQYNDLSGIVLN